MLYGLRSLGASRGTPAPGDARGMKAAEHSSKRAWAAVALLMVIGTINLADRFLPGILTEPIKHELRLTDTADGPSPRRVVLILPRRPLPPPPGHPHRD